MKNIRIFYLKIFIFGIKFSVYLNRHVFVMTRAGTQNSKLIMKTYLYNVDPTKCHFYIVKLGFTVVYIIFLISAQNIDCGYSLELPLRAEI